MENRQAGRLGICFLILCIWACGGRSGIPKSLRLHNHWEAYYNPPATYRAVLGEYRSPLVFANGDTVRTAADWKRRRLELKKEWLTFIGTWPPLLKGQHFEFLDSTRRGELWQYRVRFYWLPNQQTEGYLLVPDGSGKRPAVISVFYEPETAVGLGGKPDRDFALQLAKRGFVTLSLGTTRTTKEKTYSLYYPDIDHAVMQPLSALAYAAANALETLATDARVDASRIGIVGHSYGGKWAMFASCLYEKFACAVWIDPGIVFDETKGSNVNYWEPWYLGYYPPPWRQTWSQTSTGKESLYTSLRKEGRDLHELHALMAPRPFLVSGGYSDGVERWIPLNHTIAVNALLGYKNRVAMTNRPKHDPNPESNRLMCEFMEHWLRPHQ